MTVFARASLCFSILSAALAGCGSESSQTPADAASDRGADVSADASSDVSADASADAASDAAQDTTPVASPSTCNPLAVTAECLPPFPNDLLTRDDPSTPTHRRLVLPQGSLAVPAGTVQFEMAPFNRADGWPTSEPLVAHFGVALRRSDLVDVRHPERSVDPASTIAVFDMTTGRRVPFIAEMDANARDPERAALVIRTLTPLSFATRHVIAIRRSARSVEGAELPASPGFVALRDNTPSTDPRIEAARARYEEVFTFLTRNGYARNELQLAWDWTTASRQHVLGPILSMRQEVFRRAGVAGGIPYTIDRVQNDPNSNTARIVYGTFTPPNYLRDDNTLDFAADGSAVLQTTPRSYPFTMVIPARARRDGQPLPLVVFGHGVFGRGEDYLTGNIGTRLIQPLAEQSGAVVVATDWIGLSGDDQSLLVTQVVPNINRVTLVTDRLVQSLVNNLSLIELSVGAMGRDPMVRLATGNVIDPTRVYYYGVSLGGIQGSSLFSVSRHIQRAIVAVPGGSWSNILPRSIVYAPIKMFVDVRYPDPLLQMQFLSLLQTRFDHTDGINLATLAFRNPLPDAPAGRVVVLQEAIGDCQVPNVTTRMLARAFGVSQLTPAVEPVFGLAGITAPSTTSALAQYQLPDHLMRYTPPDTGLVPTMDNDTHSDSVSLPSALAQVRALLERGEVIQQCTGTCNPD